MKTTILILALLLISCETEPVDFTAVEKDAKVGYMNALGEVYRRESTGKTPVPECSNETPTSIRYVYRDNLGTTFERSSAIALNGNTFTTTQQMALPIGDYDVEIVELLSNTGIVTHVVPNEVDPRFPFFNYVENALPYPITISADAVYQDNPETMCFTLEAFPITELGSEGTIQELATWNFHVELGNCIDMITVQLLGGSEIQILFTIGAGQGIPMPEDAIFDVRAYFEGVVVDEKLNQTITEPNEEGTPGFTVLVNPCE